MRQGVAIAVYIVLGIVLVWAAIPVWTHREEKVPESVLRQQLSDEYLKVFLVTTLGVLATWALVLVLTPRISRPR